MSWQDVQATAIPNNSDDSGVEKSRFFTPLSQERIETTPYNFIAAAAISMSWLQSRTAGTRTSTAVTHSAHTHTHTDSHSVKPVRPCTIKSELQMSYEHRWYSTWTRTLNFRKSSLIRPIRACLENAAHEQQHLGLAVLPFGCYWVICTLQSDLWNTQHISGK